MNTTHSILVVAAVAFAACTHMENPIEEIIPEEPTEIKVPVSLSYSTVDVVASKAAQDLNERREQNRCEQQGGNRGAKFIGAVLCVHFFGLSWVGAASEAHSQMDCSHTTIPPQRQKANRNVQKEMENRKE